LGTRVPWDQYTAHRVGAKGLLKFLEVKILL
jgi:hypothetical protein